MTKKTLRHKINEFITVELLNRKTVIFIDGKPFRKCKYLLINISMDEIHEYDDIESIDDAVTKNRRLNAGEHYSRKQAIPPETEFWGHASNLQAWAENGYALELLHSNLSYALLKKLVEVGDRKALNSLKDQVAMRFENGGQNIYIFLENGMMRYFSVDELYMLYDMLGNYTVPKIRMLIYIMAKDTNHRKRSDELKQQLLRYIDTEMPMKIGTNIRSIITKAIKYLNIEDVAEIIGRLDSELIATKKNMSFIQKLKSLYSRQNTKTWLVSKLQKTQMAQKNA